MGGEGGGPRPEWDPEAEDEGPEQLLSRPDPVTACGTPGSSVRPPNLGLCSCIGCWPNTLLPDVQRRAEVRHGSAGRTPRPKPTERQLSEEGRLPGEDRGFSPFSQRTFPLWPFSPCPAGPCAAASLPPARPFHNLHVTRQVSSPSPAEQRLGRNCVPSTSYMIPARRKGSINFF